MAPSVPPSLKKIKAFIARAEELDRDKGNPESRVVAYNCRQYAVLTGIPLAGQDAAAKSYLGELLSELEKEKAAMSVFSRVEHWKISRKVADKVFEKADAEDRAGVANKGTAKSFYAAGTFFEILQQFHEQKKEGEDGGGEEDDETKAQIEEEEQRRLYCKWKATEILNAIKEGRTPTPGGYQQEEETTEQGGGFDATGLNDALPSINEELPPAAPSSMPSSNDVFNAGSTTDNTQYETQNEIEQPPPYDGIELNLNGDPSLTVEDVNDGDEDSGTEEIFIPGAVKQAAENVTNNVFVDDPTPVAPPPPYSDALPPPAASKSLPTPSASSRDANSGMLSSLFGKSSKSNKKLTKAQMADAVELTKFALTALQKGDGELGKERLEQALGVWGRKSNSEQSKCRLSEKQTSEAIELTKVALSLLQKGDSESGRKKLEQAVSICH